LFTGDFFFSTGSRSGNYERLMVSVMLFEQVLRCGIWVGKQPIL